MLGGAIEDLTKSKHHCLLTKSQLFYLSWYEEGSEEKSGFYVNYAVKCKDHLLIRMLLGCTEVA